MQRFRKGKKGIQVVTLLLVFSLLLAGFSANSMVFKAAAKGKKTVAIKSVSLNIGNEKVTNKTYKMKRGESKKIKLNVSPKKGKKTIKFTTSNKKVATVNKNGMVTAKKAGTAKVTVTVSLRKTGKSGASVKKSAWVKIKVTNRASSDKAKDTPATEPPATEPSATEPSATEPPVTGPSVTEPPSTEPTATAPPSTQNPTGKKSIVAYFSCTDNTKTIAEYVAESAGADIYRIEPSVPYTSADLNYSNADSRTSKEQNDVTARPAIAGSLPNLDNYEVVYLGYAGGIIGLN